MYESYLLGVDGRYMSYTIGKIMGDSIAWQDCHAGDPVCVSKLSTELSSNLLFSLLLLP